MVNIRLQNYSAYPLVQQAIRPTPTRTIEVAIHPDEQITCFHDEGWVVVAHIVRIAAICAYITNPNERHPFISGELGRLEGKAVLDGRNVSK